MHLQLVLPSRGPCLAHWGTECSANCSVSPHAAGLVDLVPILPEAKPSCMLQSALHLCCRLSHSVLTPGAELQQGCLAASSCSTRLPEAAGVVKYSDQVLAVLQVCSTPLFLACWVYFSTAVGLRS